MHPTCSVDLMFLALAILMLRRLVCKSCSSSNLMSPPPPHIRKPTRSPQYAVPKHPHPILVLWRRPKNDTKCCLLLTRRIKWKGKYISFSGVRDDTWLDIHFRTRFFRYVTACRSDNGAPPNSALSHFRSLQTSAAPLRQPSYQGRSILIYTTPLLHGAESFLRS
jgi:hypothetical protein